MKVTYHFRTKELGSSYGNAIYQRLFGAISSFRSVRLNSIILVGDFLPPRDLSKEDWMNVLTVMIKGDGNTWKRFDIENAKFFITENIFIVCLQFLQGLPNPGNYNEVVCEGSAQHGLCVRGDPS